MKKILVMTVLVAATVLSSATSSAATTQAFPYPYPSPTVYPNDVYSFHKPGEFCPPYSVCDSGCPVGHFCVGVWDPSAQMRKQFNFYKCTMYSLSNWYSDLGAVNHQTGGAVARLYDRNKRVIQELPPDNKMYGANVREAWYIKAC